MNDKVELGFSSITQLARGVLRHKFVFLICFLCVISVSSLYVLSMKPRYAAEAFILLPQTPSGNLSEGNQRVFVATDPMAVRSETEIVSSTDLAAKVIDTLDLANEAEFAPPVPNPTAAIVKGTVRALRAKLFGPASEAPLWSEATARRDALLSAYKQHLSVFNDGRSTIVRISFTAGTPSLAARVTNAHIAAYLTAQVERRVAGQRLAIEWLKKELDGRATELRAAETEVQTYRARNNIVLVQRANQQETLSGQELKQINEQLVSAELDATRERSRLVQFDEKAKPGDFSATTEILNGPIVAKLRQREVDARGALARLISIYPDGGSVLVGARAELASIEATMREELDRTRETIRSDLRQAETRAQLLQHRLKDASDRKLVRDLAEVELKGHETYAAAKRSIYEVVLNRYNTLLAEQGFSAADSKVISLATTPTQQAFPKTGLFLTFAGLVSATAAGCAALATDRLRTGVTSLRILSSSFGVRVLGVVPVLGSTTKLLIGATPVYDLFWEQIRAVRNRIIDVRSDESVVVLVTSPLPQEGKSVLAASLARAAANIGISTLLIDGDLHRPSAARVLGVLATNGLGDVMANRVSLDAAIVATHHKQLDLLASSPEGAVATDVLTSGYMAGLVRSLRDRYRFIIIDSPAIAFSSDALSLAGFADATVVLTRVKRASSGPVSQAIRMLQEQGVKIAGLVLVGIDDSDVLYRPKSRTKYALPRNFRFTGRGRLGAGNAVREAS